MKLATEKIGEERIDIEVSPAGKFMATFNDQEFTADTLDLLTVQLTKAVKKAADQGIVDVTVLGVVERPKSSYSSDGPFMDGIGYVHAKLRGKHERRNDFLLVTDDYRFDKKKFSVGGYRSSNVIARRLTDDEAARYLALRETVRAAQVDVEDFVGGVKLDVDEALKAARKPETVQS